MSINCPLCHKDDRIYKVSTIYSGGISHGTFSTTEGSVSGSSQTVLSQNLAPPPKPSVSCFVWGCSILFVAMSCLSCFWFGMNFLFLRDIGAALEDIMKSPLSFAGQIGGAAFYLVIALAIYFIARNSANSKLPSWSAAMEVWDRCYYCDRNGIVFDPMNPTPIPVNGFQNYLKGIGG